MTAKIILVTSLLGSLAAILLFFLQAEGGIRDWSVTGVQTCALPILLVATPGYLARHAQITEPGQLLAHPFISLGYGQFQNEVELRPLHPAAAPATRLLVNTPDRKSVV